MLKQRILTAAILIPLVLVSILYTSPLLFHLILAGILLLAGWEWSQLIPLKKTHLQIGYLALIAITFYLSTFLPASSVIILGTVAWIGVSYYLATHFLSYVGLLKSCFATGDAYGAGFLRAKMGTPPPAPPAAKQDFNNPYVHSGQWLKQPIVIALAGIVALMVCFASLNFLRDQSPQWVMVLLLIVWIADIAAYFSGRRFGQRALAPQISPKKTWEGVFGALVAVIAIILLNGWLMKVNMGLLISLILLGIVTTLISIIGDLFESLLKRQNDVKDSSQLLPGHGGILDRIDSLIAAAPCFAAGVLLLLF